METEIKNVTLPLNVTELKRFVEKRDCFYVVDYKKSELRDGIFLNYISNLELPAEVVFSDCSFEEKEALFYAYLTGQNITTMDSLRLNIAQMLLQYREIPTEGLFDSLAFDPEERGRFIRKNISLLSRWESFIESTIVFSAYCVQEFDLFWRNQRRNLKRLTTLNLWAETWLAFFPFLPLWNFFLYPE